MARCQPNPPYPFTPSPVMPGAIPVPVPTDNPPNVPRVTGQPIALPPRQVPASAPYTPNTGTNFSGPVGPKG
jgi:hypothetical protein